MTFGQFEAEVLKAFGVAAAAAATGLIAKGAQYASNAVAHLKIGGRFPAIQAALQELTDRATTALKAAAAAGALVIENGQLNEATLAKLLTTVTVSLSQSASTILTEEYSTLAPLLTPLLQAVASDLGFLPKPVPTPIAAPASGPSSK